MAKKEVSIDQIVKKQIKKWEGRFDGKKSQAKAQIPVITVSMEPGSGGSILAARIAERLEFDYFHRDIVEKIAKTAKIRGAVVNSLEKERFTGVKDFISSLVEDQYIHPDTYLRHLLPVISTIGWIAAQESVGPAVERGIGFKVGAVNWLDLADKVFVHWGSWIAWVGTGGSVIKGHHDLVLNDLPGRSLG